MLRKITGYYVVILKCLLWTMNYLCCHRLFNVKVYNAAGRDGWVLLVVGYATSDCSATGCPWNVVFFSEDFKVFRTLAFLCFHRCQCVYTHKAGKKPALQQSWQSSEKSQNFKEITQYLLNTLYINLKMRELELVKATASKT